jgi:alkaline phosphatase D
MGAAQVAWLKRALVASTATWKVMASSLPIGLVVRDFPDYFEAVAQGDPGGPLGRELEIADLLRFIRDENIDNVVWITGDVHYAAAHHYDPARARFSSSRRSGVRGRAAARRHVRAERARPTFGPEVRCLSIPDGMKPNRPPSKVCSSSAASSWRRRPRRCGRAHDRAAAARLYTVTLPPGRR